MKRSYFLPGSKRAQFLAQARYAGGSGSGKRPVAPVDEEEEEDDFFDGEEEESEEEEEVEEQDGDEEEEADGQRQRQVLLRTIRKNIDSQIKKHKIANGKQIRSMIEGALEGLPLQDLKNFGNYKKTVRTIAGKLEEMNEGLSRLQVGNMDAETFVRKLVDKHADDMVSVLKSRSTGRELKIRAASIMTTDNVASGVVPDDIMDSASIAAFQPAARPRQYISDIADVRTVDEISEYKVWYDEGDEEGAFAIVEEGGLKPLVSFDLVRNYHEWRKAAGKVVFTEEVPKFKKRIYQILLDLFRGKLWRDYQNILTADLVTAAASYTGTALDATIPAATITDFHAIGAVSAQIEALEFNPDVLILNPQDKWRMALSQSSDGQFYMAVPQRGPDGVITMMGLRVIVSSKIPVGKFILGESGAYKIEQEAVQIRVGYGISMNSTVVEHDFDHNRFRIIGEIYFHNYITSSNTGSFVMGDFSLIKTALTAPETP